MEGHGAMSKRRHDDIVVTCMNNELSSSIVRFPCSCWSLMLETLLGIIAVRQRFEIGVDAAWISCFYHSFFAAPGIAISSSCFFS